MKLLNIFSIILSIIALIGSIYSYRRTSKTIAMIESLDDVMYQWMKDDLNSRVKEK